MQQGGKSSTPKSFSHFSNFLKLLRIAKSLTAQRPTAKSQTANGQRLEIFCKSNYFAAQNISRLQIFCGFKYFTGSNILQLQIFCRSKYFAARNISQLEIFRSSKYFAARNILLLEIFRSSKYLAAPNILQLQNILQRKRFCRVARICAIAWRFLTEIPKEKKAPADRASEESTAIRQAAEDRRKAAIASQTAAHGLPPVLL